MNPDTNKVARKQEKKQIIIKQESSIVFYKTFQDKMLLPYTRIYIYIYIYMCVCVCVCVRAYTLEPISITKIASIFHDKYSS